LPESSFNISAANFVPTGFEISSTVTVTSTEATEKDEEDKKTPEEKKEAKVDAPETAQDAETKA